MKRREILSLAGNLSGIAALGWNTWNAARNEAFRNPQISMKVEKLAKDFSAYTSLKNPGSARKFINYAALLITPEGLAINEALREILRANGKTVPDVELHLRSALAIDYTYRSDDKRLAQIPLPFYYKEQAYIGNEETACRAHIRSSDFQPDAIYDVRFFILFEGAARSCHDLFVNSI